MTKEAALTNSIALQLFSYDGKSGLLRWRRRTPDMFATTRARSAEHACNNWNSRYADTTAGAGDGHGYLSVIFRRRHYKAHRIIWLIQYGCWPDADVDHRNGDRIDNRLENLRAVSRAGNRQNVALSKNNTSGFTGVFWRPAKKKWAAIIGHNRKNINLGYFELPEDANTAYLAAKAKLHISQPIPRANICRSASRLTNPRY